MNEILQMISSTTRQTHCISLRQHRCSPDIVCSGQRLDYKVPCANIPGAPFFGFLMEGRHIAGLPNGGKQGEGGCACAFHTQVLEQTAWPIGPHRLGQHAVHSLIHSAAEAYSSEAQHDESVCQQWRRAITHSLHRRTFKMVHPDLAGPF